MEMKEKITLKTAGGKSGVSSTNAPAETTALKKEIGLFEAITMVVGVVIGSGIFFKASPVFTNAGTPFMGIMAWIVGGIITMASALTVTEIATAIPKTGGVFVYLKTLYGDKVAFLFGWVQSIIYVPGVTAALSIVFVTQATFFIPMGESVQKVLAIGLIFFIILINYLSTKLGSKVQLFATIGKLIPICVIIGCGLVMGKAQGMQAIFGSIGGGAAGSGVLGSGAAGGSAISMTGFGAAVIGTLWAYDGWVGVGNMAGELKNPGKDLPKAIIMGLMGTIVVYILINIAIINVIPVEVVTASKKAASDAAVVLFGNAGASLIAAGILVSIFGALNGYLMTGVRIPFAMAQDGLLPFSEFIGKVDDKCGTPLNAFLFQGGLATLYVLSGSFETLTNLAMFVVWLFFVMVVAGIFILRSKFAHLERSYTVPLYPFVPIVGIVGGIYIIVSTLIGDTNNALIGLAITLIGLPVHSYVQKKRLR